MIGFVLPANIRFAPYIRQYIDICKENKMSYEIIAWNKCGIPESSDHTFQYSLKAEKKDLFYHCRKFLALIRFSRYAKKICSKHHYDKIVVFSPALGILLSGFLNKCYKGKYIYDIRDYSPTIDKFQKRFHLAVKNAAFAVISSPGFAAWLGDADAYLSHNAEVKEIEERLKIATASFDKSECSIVSIGALREYEMNSRLIEQIGNDRRYQLIFIGQDTADKLKLRQFADGYRNVSFEGAYDKEEVYAIYSDRATLVNAVRKINKFNQFALPNKLYEGTIAGIPILTLCGNLELARVVRKYRLGIVLDTIESENLGEILWDAVQALDCNEYSKGRKQFLLDVLDDQYEFEKMVRSFFTTN